MTVRARRDGWQVIVYAGLDPHTGKQHQITRQVNDSLRAAKQIEARLRAEVADGRHVLASAESLVAGRRSRRLHRAEAVGGNAAELIARGDVELGEDLAQVVLHRSRTDEQSCADLRVG
jgi:hypothetical protein